MTMTSPIAREQDAIADESDEPAGPQPAARWGLASRCATVLQNEMTLIVVLVGSFFGRWMVADRKSYWLDEILSVTVYGVDNDNVIEAVRRLAQGSVHPPLYQATLYVWMELFGTSERATRSLSNLYITLATLFLFLLLRTAFSRGVALMSAVAFTLMYTATYYGLETRSYAQTIFLVTLSSYALLLLARAGKARGWRPALRSPVSLLFLAANVGLLLTHYYNVFFWAAQALIVAVYVLREWPPRRWPLALGVAAALYALQAAIFLAVWGKVLYRTYERRSDAFAVEGAVRSPWELAESVITPNIDPPWWLRWLGLAVAAVMIGRAVVVLARRRSDSAAADADRRRRPPRGRRRRAPRGLDDRLSRRLAAGAGVHGLRRVRGHRRRPVQPALLAVHRAGAGAARRPHRSRGRATGRPRAAPRAAPGAGGSRRRWSSSRR